MRRGGRLILLLGFLIAALVALGVFFFVQQGALPQQNAELLPPTTEPTRRVVVARIDLPSNTLLTDTETYLSVADIPETQFNASAGDFFTSPDQLTDKVTVRPVGVTVPLRASDVTDAGLSVRIPPAREGQPRTKAISLLVNNLTGVADEITPNDFVDILSSFSISRTYLRPGFNDDGTVRVVEEQFSGLATKTLIQNVQVLGIKRLAVVAEGTTTPTAEPALDASGQPVDQGGQATGNTGAAAANAGNTITPGSWLLVLAVTDQQAEILEFSRKADGASGITLVLRGRGDDATETTLGATLDLLIKNFGLPLPNPEVPAISGEDQLTPLPTTQPTAPSATTPTPTPAP